MTHPNWINELFQAIDRKDARSFASFLTEEGVFRYGSQPAVKGRVAVERYVTGFFGMLSSLRHQILDFHANDPDGICYVRGDVTYTLAGGREVKIPFLNYLRMEGEQIAEYLVYTDPTALQA